MGSPTEKRPPISTCFNSYQCQIRPNTQNVYKIPWNTAWARRMPEKIETRFAGHFVLELWPMSKRRARSRIPTLWYLNMMLLYKQSDETVQSLCTKHGRQTSLGITGEANRDIIFGRAYGDGLLARRSYQQTFRCRWNTDRKPYSMTDWCLWILNTRQQTDGNKDCPATRTGRQNPQRCWTYRHQNAEDLSCKTRCLFGCLLSIPRSAYASEITQQKQRTVQPRDGNDFFFLLSCCTHTTLDLLVTASRTCTINIVGGGQYT